MWCKQEEAKVENPNHHDGLWLLLSWVGGIMGIEIGVSCVGSFKFSL